MACGTKEAANTKEEVDARDDSAKGNVDEDMKAGGTEQEVQEEVMDQTGEETVQGAKAEAQDRPVNEGSPKAQEEAVVEEKQDDGKEAEEVSTTSVDGPPDHDSDATAVDVDVPSPTKSEREEAKADPDA